MSLKSKFEFILSDELLEEGGLKKSDIFTAIKSSDIQDVYIVSWVVNGEFGGYSNYEVKNVERYVRNGDWIIV
jgi:hypothetical protein